MIGVSEATRRAQAALQLRMRQLGVQLDADLVEPCLGELAALIVRRVDVVGGCPIVGLSGAQGTGKSTLAWLLSDLLWHGFGKRSTVVSLDDYYLARAERAALTKHAHPLLVTRGVPGTHAVATLQAALRSLRLLAAGECCALLRFDKATDERMSETRDCVGPLDLILLEGWCVGARPQSSAELAEPVNTLESLEDLDGTFRGFVNTQLAGPYAALWHELELLVYLAAPDMQSVLAFRAQQEDMLRRAAGTSATGLMDESKLRRFIQHFERLTLHMLRTGPDYADAIVQVDANRRWTLNVRSV